MTKRPQRGVIGLATLALAFFAVSGCMPAMVDGDEQVWSDSFSKNASGKLMRFIPPELWSGASWNGDRNLNRLPPFDHHAKMISERAPIHISGPIRVSPTDNPNCTKPIYKLDGARSHGDKIEYYQINIDAGGKKGGIGRCWRSQGGRIIDLNEFSKFPIGYWAEGEKYKNIRILDLGTPESSCLKFHWKGGRDGNSWGVYTYCPGRGRIKGVSKRKTERRH